MPIGIKIITMTEEKARSILGVTGILFISKVKKAFRLKSLKYHPDKGGTTQEFDLVYKSYDFLIKLSIPDKPKEDDSSNTSEPIEKTQPYDYVRKIKTTELKDVEYPVKLSIQELHDGFDLVVRFNRLQGCEICEGKGCYICLGAIDNFQIEEKVYVHSSLMTKELEIVYKSLGHNEVIATDLVLKLDLVPSKFSFLELKEGQVVPNIGSSLNVVKSAKRVHIPTLNGTLTILNSDDIPNPYIIKDGGLEYTINGVKVKSDHIINLKFL